MSKFSHILLAALTLTGATTLLAACDANEPETRSVSISADELAALPDGEAYLVDGNAPITRLDPSAGPLDLSRVTLKLGDRTVPLAEALRSAPELAGIPADALDNADIMISDAADEQASFRNAQPELEPDLGCVWVQVCYDGVCVRVTVCV